MFVRNRLNVVWSQKPPTGAQILSAHEIAKAIFCSGVFFSARFLCTVFAVTQCSRGEVRDIFMAPVCTEFTKHSSTEHSAFGFRKAAILRRRLKNVCLTRGRWSLNSSGRITLGSARRSNETRKAPALPIAFNDEWFPGAAWNIN